MRLSCQYGRTKGKQTLGPLTCYLKSMAYVFFHPHACAPLAAATAKPYHKAEICVQDSGSNNNKNTAVPGISQLPIPQGQEFDHTPGQRKIAGL